MTTPPEHAYAPKRPALPFPFFPPPAISNNLPKTISRFGHGVVAILSIAHPSQQARMIAQSLVVSSYPFCHSAFRMSSSSSPTLIPATDPPPPKPKHAVTRVDNPITCLRSPWQLTVRTSHFPRSGGGGFSFPHKFARDPLVQK